MDRSTTGILLCCFLAVCASFVGAQDLSRPKEVPGLISDTTKGVSMLMKDAVRTWRKDKVDLDHCQTACKKTRGCVAVSYCGNAEGCGNGCQAYAAANMRPGKAPAKSPAPVKYSGPVNDFCSKAKMDAWAEGTCTLWSGVSPTAPVVIPLNNAKSKGWKSYVWTVPAACGGVEIEACQSCTIFRDPKPVANKLSAKATACLDCAKANLAVLVKAKTDKVQLPVWTKKDDLRSPLELCSFCTGLTNLSHQKECFDAIKANDARRIACMHKYLAKSKTKNANKNNGDSLNSCLKCAKDPKALGCPKCIMDSTNSASCLKCMLQKKDESKCS